MNRLNIPVAIPCFFHPELTPTDDVIVLCAAEGGHAVKSRRLRVGDSVNLLNGNGLSAKGVIEQIDRKQVSVQVGAVKQHPAPREQLTIATAVPKGDRQKVMIDMVTQLGVTGVIPLECDYSVTKFSQNMRDKWLRSAIEACKQSQNPWLPAIGNMMTPRDLVKPELSEFVYAAQAGIEMRNITDLCPSVTVLIGPEGGFSPAEQALFESCQLKAVSLGPFILRTEAAAIAAAAQWHR